MPAPSISPDRVVAAIVTESTQLLENSDQGKALTRLLPFIPSQNPIKLGLPATKLRPRLNLSLVAELCRPRTQHLAHRVPSYG